MGIGAMCALIAHDARLTLLRRVSPDHRAGAMSSFLRALKTGEVTESCFGKGLDARPALRRIAACDATHLFFGCKLSIRKMVAGVHVASC